MSDPGKETARAYGVLSLGFAARNTVYIGKDGRILYIDRQVSAKTAGDDVAKKLAELKVPHRGSGGSQP